MMSAGPSASNRRDGDTSRPSSTNSPICASQAMPSGSRCWRACGSGRRRASGRQVAERRPEVCTRSEVAKASRQSASVASG